MIQFAVSVMNETKHLRNSKQKSRGRQDMGSPEAKNVKNDDFNPKTLIQVCKNDFIWF